MPKIKTGQRRQSWKEKLDEVRRKQEEKKGQGHKLTVEDLEERVAALEKALEERR